jgi:hypothetical protein
MNTDEADDLVEQIANDTAELLTTDDICGRLSISRTTLERWRKAHQFPAPDIYIGRARWSMATFKKWLETKTIRDGNTCG